MSPTATIQEDKKQYERVADHVRTLIDSGTLKPGDKIPSVRRMSSQRKVSITTVLEAYHRLEDAGLIKARPQSGYFVHPSVIDAAPEPSQKCSNCVPTEVTVSDRIYEVFSEASNPDFVQFGAATLHPSLLPLKTLGRISARLVRDHSAQAHSYDFPPGNPALRKEIAKRSLDSGCSLAPEEILLTSGGTEAIRLCLEAVTERGDVVGVESPTYYWFLEVIDRLGLKAVEIPTHPKKGIELEPLEELIERGEVDALLLVPTVSNPLGSTMPDQKKKRLAEIATAAKIPLIEDDIWGELSYQPFRPRTIKSFDREGWVLLCSAYSKTLAPGFRMGWTVPGRFYKEVMRRKISSTLSNDALSTMVLSEFLSTGGCDRYLRRIRRQLEDQVRRFSAAILESFPEGTRISRPSGGCLLWVELPEGVNARLLHDRAAQREISIIPGDIFSPTGRYTNFTRINCGQEWSARVEVGLETLGRLVGERW